MKPLFPTPIRSGLFTLCLATVAALPARSQDPGGEVTIRDLEAGQEAPNDAYTEIERLVRIMEIVRENYVDEQKVTYRQLIDHALEGMLAGLDPHSQFLFPKVFEEMREQTEESMAAGVGITVSLEGNLLTIIAVQKEGPAARSGVIAGDQILRINDISTERSGLTEAQLLLQGEPGETLRLTLRRPSTQELLEVELLREVVREATVQGPQLLPPDLAGERRIGYVRVVQFNGPTSRDLELALDALEKEGMQALVLDLRDNPGGLVQSAVEVCGLFLPPSTPVLTMEGRDPARNPPPFVTPERQLRPRSYPLAVLINANSASGAELVAGALQDLRRAIITGETSFGKGSVQTILPLDGAALRLTTAKYYTPGHRTIHENGVVPDIVAALTPAEERLLRLSWNRENLSPGEEAELPGFRDRQLDRAADALKAALFFLAQQEASTGSGPEAPTGPPSDGPDEPPPPVQEHEDPPSQEPSTGKPGSAEDDPARDPG